jgi:AcrR family transcriptional regulator
MSKSGLYAHFGSKEELQLATIDKAAEIFTREVIEPARPAEGAARLLALTEAFLSYLDRRVFPGGCFFAAAQAELDTHPGPVREKLRETGSRWLDYIERQVRGAQELGDLRADEDPAQLAFELDAMLKMATAVFVLQDDPAALERARRGVKTRLTLAAA